MNILSKGRYIKSSCRKLRLVANLIRGKNVINALNILNFTNKKSSLLIKKVLLSAIFNAYNKYNINKKFLLVSKIYIDHASSSKRIIPRAKGRLNYILKKTSHITLYLSKINLNNNNLSGKLYGTKSKS